MLQRPKKSSWQGVRNKLRETTRSGETLTCSGLCKQLGLNPVCVTKISVERGLSTLLGWEQLPRKHPREFDVGQRELLDQAFQKHREVGRRGSRTSGRGKPAEQCSGCLYIQESTSMREADLATHHPQHPTPNISGLHHPTSGMPAAGPWPGRHPASRASPE